MTFLLDVNVLIALIALIDPAHVAHNAAHRWFDGQGRHAWASCPLTENGVVRIVGNSRYPNTPGSPAQVADIVRALCALPGHVFWPDDLSLCDDGHIDCTQIHMSSQVTDLYLLASAVRHGGKLATFDRRISPNAVRGGADALVLIGD